MIEFTTKCVEKYFNAAPGTFNRRSRKREIVYPRQLIQYFAKKYTKLSLEYIGVYTGGYDHATILNSIKTIKNLIDTDQQTRIDVKEIDKVLFLEYTKRKSPPPDILKMMNPANYITKADLEEINPNGIQIKAHYGWDNIPIIILLKARSNNPDYIGPVAKVIANVREFTPVANWGIIRSKKNEFKHYVNRLRTSNPDLIHIEFSFKIEEPRKLQLFE